LGFNGVMHVIFSLARTHARTHTHTHTHRERESLTGHPHVLLYVAHVALRVLWKLLKGPGSRGVTLPARKCVILDVHSLQHFLVGCRTEREVACYVRDPRSLVYLGLRSI